MTIPIASPKNSASRLNRQLAAALLAVPTNAPPRVVDQAAERTAHLVDTEERNSQQRIVHAARLCLNDPEWGRRQRPALGYVGFAVLLVTEIAALICAFQLITGWLAFVPHVPQGESLPKTFILFLLFLNFIWVAAIVWRSLSPTRGRRFAGVLYWLTGGLALLADLITAAIAARADVDPQYAFSPFIMMLIALALCIANNLLTKHRERGVA